MALPPRDEMVCTPEPPSWQPWFPAGFSSDGGSCGLGVARGVGGRDSRGLPAVFVGVGSGCRREALGEGVGLGERVGRAEGVGEAEKSSGADCATGAVGLVEPTTKWTVNITAVTLAVVHDSQMSR